MARLARIVIPGIPYHVTQRGNRRQQTFFEDGDYALYRDLLAEAARRAGAGIWAYCLMPNHVHLIVVPSDADGLRRTFADAHRRYTGFINARQRWTGHLWQGRYGAVAMDETHLAAAARYVALIRCGLGWSIGPTSGSGRACGRTWRARTTSWSRSRRCSSGLAISRRSSAEPRISRRLRRCGSPRPPAGRPVVRNGSAR
jgi:REP element-mobilizing transposase RayT